MTTRVDCIARDRSDALAPLRSQFALERVDAEGVIYLDGNSLGVLPKAAADRVRQVVEDEWGAGLIRSWNSAGWITLSQRIAAKIARLIGAGAEQVAVADSTSINLYKVLSAAIAIGPGSASFRNAPTFRPTSTSPIRWRASTGFELRARRSQRDRRSLEQSARDPDVDARQLPHRPHARHVRHHSGGARGGRPHDLGSRALRRRHADRRRRR